MLTFLAYIMGLIIYANGSAPALQPPQHPVSAAFAEGMSYYQSEAIQTCWDAQNQAFLCGAGLIPLTPRPGSSGVMLYGSGFVSFTDGSSYIATTIGPSAPSMMDTTEYGSIIAALNDQTEQSMTVGFYNQSLGGVYLGNHGGEIVRPSFVVTPVNGQPVLYQPVHTR